MKTLKNITNKAIILLAVTFIISSCSHKNDDNFPASAAEKGKLVFHIHSAIGDNELETYDSVYQDDTGRKMQLSLAQFYISGIQLVKVDGNVYDVPNVKLLKTLDEDLLELGDVPVGNYQSIRFKVGLDPATNLMMPTASGDSIILNHPEMWFGSSAQPDGYIFMHAKGQIDTTLDISGKQLQAFNISLGTNARYTQINMPVKNFSVTSGNVQYVHILVDYAKLFQDIQLNISENLMLTTVAANASALGTQYGVNLQSMFRYE